MTSHAAPPVDDLLALNGPSIDGSWYRGMTGFAQHTPWLQPLMTAYTTAGILVLCALPALAWWNARRRGDLASITAIAWAGTGTLVCIAATAVLKQVFAETRPCLAIAHVTTVQPCPGVSDYSFPSNHTTIAAALAAGIWLASRRLGLLAAVLALLEGFSRIYLGQHYPHDVLAALVLAVVIITGGWPLVRRPLAYVMGLLARTPLRPLLSATR
jgi:membrane-associated phospholipid phosphatase